MKSAAGRAQPAGARRFIGVIRMARAGRKRKLGPRDAAGRLKKPKKEDLDDKVRTTRQPHRRALMRELRARRVGSEEAQKLAAGEEAESPIGRLWAAGHLKRAGDADSQAARDRYDAGNMFAQIVGAYRSVIGAPSGGAGAGGSHGRGRPCPADLLCTLDPESCLCAKTQGRYDRAFEALTRFSRRALMAVNKVAVHREPIEAQELVYLVSGLEELRRVFGLTGRRRSGQSRNAS